MKKGFSLVCERQKHIEPLQTDSGVAEIQKHWKESVVLERRHVTVMQRCLSTGPLRGSERTVAKAGRSKVTSDAG